MKLDILAFGAHPDDVEMGCGGTIAKSTASGKTVGIIDLTRGELGTNGTPELRDKEANSASKIIGAKFRINLGFQDGFIFNNKELPIYARGNNSREWIHVNDHCEALFTLYLKGKNGESYNVGSGINLKNIDLVKKLLKVCKSDNIKL